MDVRLPNGRVISNIPEGVSKQEVMSMAVRNGLASESDFSQSSSQQQSDQSPSQPGSDSVSAAEQKFGLPPGLLAAVISKESSGNPNAVSGKGAIGLTQVMPNTARGMGYDPEALKRNPALQVEAGARYLKQMIDQQGNIPDALAAYNMGPGNMQKLKQGKMTSVPTETANYVTDPRFAQWTQPAQPGTDDELTQLSQQATQPWAQATPEATQPWAQATPEATPMQNLGQAGRGLAQTAVNVANIPSEIGNAIYDADAWMASMLSGKPVAPTRMPAFQLPESAQPTDPNARIGAEIGPYLIPGIGAERTAAALGSAATGGRVERVATQVASMLAENLPGAVAQSTQNNDLGGNLATGLAGSVIGRSIIAAGGRAMNVGRSAAQREGQVAAAGAEPTAPGAEPRGGTAREADIDAEPPPVSNAERDAAAPGYAQAAQSGKEGRVRQVVNDIQPDQDVVNAMRRLDLDPDDMLEAYTSGNDAFKAVQIGLASQDESALAAVKRDSINRISTRAAKIIDDAGAMPDRLAMNDKFISEFNTTRNAMKAKEAELYKPVEQAIPPRSEVDPKNTRNYLDNLADEQGGYEHLSPLEKKIYDKVAPQGADAGAPTYARLNTARSIVGAELGKSGTPFGSAEERNLSQLYSMLSKDRDDVARAAGFGDQIKAANAVTAQRKMMEKNVYGLLDKDLSGNITVKAKNALDGLQSGNTQAFTRLLRAVPDKGMRSQLIATGMRDMFRKGNTSEVEDNINGFVKYYAALKRNGTIRLLHKELPPATNRELEEFYTLARNVKSANRYHLATGKINAFLAKFDQAGGFLDKLATHGKMAGIAMALGHVPVVGPVLNTAVAAQMGAQAAMRKTGATAVQEMMGSPVWKDLAAAARTKPSTAAQAKIVAAAEKRIASSKAWKEFYRTLPRAEKEKIARVGIIGWLSGVADDRED